MSEFLHEPSEWEKEIINKYPLIYKEPNENLRDWYNEEKYKKLITDPNFCNLRYGFEFHKGWANLVDKFSNIAQSLVLHLRQEVQPNAYIKACIFKEKFGTLCWQGDNNLISPFSELFRAYVAQIEKESQITCEETGARGTLCRPNGTTGGGWVRTLSKEMCIQSGYIPTNENMAKQWGIIPAQPKNSKII